HNNTASSGDAIYVCPGNTVADYGTNAPQAGTTWTSKNSTTITFGLPNISSGNPTTNTAFWDTLREPAFANQIIAPSSVIAGSPGSISFSWSGATDPNAADGTTGYIVLRNTSNTFTPPADGTTYVTGANIGSATVIVQITSSAITTYTDNTVMNGNAYYYRVYAFRYATDNVNGNTFHRSRGRAYTSTFAEIQEVNPLPVELISFNALVTGNEVYLAWQTASELNNDYFIIERATDQNSFIEIGRVDGYGNSSQEHSYIFIDQYPTEGNNYYRLKQTDFNGQYNYSNTVAINFVKAPTPPVITTWNCEAGICFRLEGGKGMSQLEVFDMNGNLIYAMQTSADEPGIIPLGENANAIYILRISQSGFQQTKKISSR
ncbi:MAG: T9SS type A sorting domain-containing protein, partial [Bacteroidia bacterium]